jgi:hypothetical protein
MRLALLSLGAAVALGISTPAHAGDPAAAQAAYDAGMQLANDGRWAEACPKFLASVNFDRQLGAMLHLADCYENVGKLASSWASWREGLELARKVNDDRIPTIQERIAKIELRLAHLRIDVANAQVALTVERDELVVHPATFGLEVPVDPGPITIRVLRGEQLLEERKTNATEAQRAIVAIDLAAIDAAHPIPKPPPVVVPKPRPLAPAKPYSPTQRYVGIGIGAAGLAATLIAGGLEIGALVKKGQANDPSACVNKLCTSAGYEAAEDGARLANVGQWLGLGGLVILGVGVVVFVTAPSPPKAEAAAALLPWFDAMGAAGASFTTRW